MIVIVVVFVMVQPASTVAVVFPVLYFHSHHRVISIVGSSLTSFITSSRNSMSPIEPALLPPDAKALIFDCDGTVIDTMPQQYVCRGLWMQIHHGG